MVALLSRRNVMGGICAGAALSVLGGGRAALACSDAILRIGIEAFPPTLNPLIVRDLVASRALSAMYDGLTQIDRDGQIRPALAERWWSEDDGLSWFFRLRRGVRFHSGRLLTALDVKKTFEALLTAKDGPSFAVPNLAKVVGREETARTGVPLAGVEVLGDLDLVVRFSEPCAIFPFYKFLILDIDYIREQGPDWFSKCSAGTGPYRFLSWMPGVRLDLVSHGDWWEGQSAHRSMAFVVTGGRERSIDAFNANETDLVLIDPDLVRKTIDGRGFQRSLTSCPRMQTRFVALDQRRYAPFKDERVRRAMSLTIDRDAVAERFFREMAVVHNGVVPPSILSDDHLVPLEYDPARARELLAEAGFRDGRGMEPFVFATIPDHREELSYVVSQWNNIGIPVTLRVVPKNEFIASYKRNEYVAWHMGWTAAYPDAMNFLGELFVSNSPFNYLGWNNAEFDALIAEANATIDQENRTALYRKAESIIMADFPVVPLVVPDYVALRCAEVVERNLSPFGGIVVR